MSIKPRYKRRILWSIITLVGLIGLLFVIVPPMINLNKLKPKLQRTIWQQTGTSAKINGDIHFSLLGGATIVAHDIDIESGHINNISFTVPLRYIFKIDSAPLSGDISVHGGRLAVSRLEQVRFNHDINLYNTTVRFLGKDYDIIRANLSRGTLRGTVRTNQHKYDIDFSDYDFTIRNQNDNLVILGQLYPDGTARGQIAIETKDINRWFEFSEPKINTPVKLTTYFDWDGGYGFKFTDINANGEVFGNIELYPDGSRNIQLRGNDIDFNMSFLLNPTKMLQNTNFDLDFYGDLRLSDYEFHHIKILATGTSDTLYIDTVIADNIILSGGTINKDGAKNILVKMPYQNIPATCLFSGSPTNWTCQTFTWGNTNGTIAVNNKTFSLSVSSPDMMPTYDTITRHTSRLGNQGHVDFAFSNMSGSLEITPTNVIPQYNFAKDKTLTWLNPDFKFLPEFMTNEVGDFIWRSGIMDFNPHTNRWFLSLGNNRFFISGTNFKNLFPNLDLQSLNDLEYTISGAYNRNNISDLRIQIGDHEFTGTMIDGNLTIKTKLLNLDSFISQHFIDNYSELEFLTTSPFMIPFELKPNIYLSADTIIYNGDEYANFVYSLKPELQTFSITDNSRGNLLAIIQKEKNLYDISLQMNRFITHGALLHKTMPLNLYDTTITADIELTTSGLIAHDLAYNLSGKIDLIFDGGYVEGIGMDEFYAAAESITRFNAEYALSRALESGRTKLKTMRIIGQYSDGNFKTSQPIMLQMPHIDATGELEITQGNMRANLNMTLRGTSPTPAPIALQIAPNNTRGYSLSDIMREFDTSFMRAFVKTHNRF